MQDSVTFPIAGCDVIDIALGIEFLPCRYTRHIANGAEDRTFEPWTVMYPCDGPCNALIAIRIASVELILIVQNHSIVKGPCRVRRPFENLLRPVHAQVIMHPSVLHHLHLRGVP